MEVFYACLGIAGAIILVVVSLTLFFRLLDRLDRRRQWPVRQVQLRGLFDPGRTLTIYLVDRTVMTEVRLLGTLADDVGKGAPMPLRDMLVVEHPDGSRALIRAKHVKSIEMPAPA